MTFVENINGACYLYGGKPRSFKVFTCTVPSLRFAYFRFWQVLHA